MCRGRRPPGKSTVFSGKIGSSTAALVRGSGLLLFFEGRLRIARLDRFADDPPCPLLVAGQHEDGVGREHCIAAKVSERGGVTDERADTLLLERVAQDQRL